MSYFKEVDTAVQEIDNKLDEIEELLLGLPIRAGHKSKIQNMIYELYTEIEMGVELSAVDFE
jgi:CHASE3 domain sensor protein